MFCTGATNNLPRLFISAPWCWKRVEYLTPVKIQSMKKVGKKTKQFLRKWENHLLVHTWFLDVNFTPLLHDVSSYCMWIISRVTHVRRCSFIRNGWSVPFLVTSYHCWESRVLTKRHTWVLIVPPCGESKDYTIRAGGSDVLLITN